MIKSIGDRLAEAFAEYLHKKTRSHFPFGKKETWTQEDLIKEKYQGIRPAPGYPACPDHSEKLKIWNQLDIEDKIGCKLTENFAMSPGSSVSGYYFFHPEAKYFTVGKIGQDQIQDYIERKKSTKSVIEKYLVSNL